MTVKSAPAVAESARQTTVERQGLVVWAASKFGVDPGKVFPILKQTCFRGEKNNDGSIREASDAEVAALMIVAREHGLNPFLKEMFAFPDKKGGIVPVVGVDGWIRILNSHPEYDGVEFAYEKDDGTPAWVECRIFRKDRSHAIVVREFMAECKRGTGPWGSHPARMLRHKALIQCARVAFGFAGIYDEDEAERIVEGQALEHAPQPQPQPQRGAAALRTALVGDGINVAETVPAATGTVTKHAGSAAKRDEIIKKFGSCDDADILDLVRDEAREYEWTAPDKELIDVAYSKRQDELKK